MKIRCMQSVDVEAIANLFTDSIHALAAAHYDAAQRDAWAPQPPDIDEWRARLETLSTLIAEEQQRLAGFISFDANGHIELLYAAPHAARRGVASALYAEAERELRARNALTLTTEASLVAAPFFSAQGFIIVEEQSIDRRGVSFRRFAMRKTLDHDSQRR